MNRLKFLYRICLSFALFTLTIHALYGGVETTVPASSPNRESVVDGNRRIERFSGLTLALYHLREQGESINPSTSAISFLVSHSETEFGGAFQPDNLQIVNVIESPVASTIHLQQTCQGLPIYGGFSSVVIDREGRIRQVIANPLPGFDPGGITPLVRQSAAIEIARQSLNVRGALLASPDTQLMGYRDRWNEDRLTWRVIIVSLDPLGDWEILLDARDGSVLSINDRACYEDGTGFVFNPDPLTTAEVEYGGAYVDQEDADLPELNDQRVEVTLHDIFYDGDTYSLLGPWVQIKDFEPPYYLPVQVLTPDGFHFTRGEQGFEEVSVYYHIDQAQRHLRFLGYEQIQDGPIIADAHGLNGLDNSHYLPDINSLAFGEGGVDDAEDADVIYHEYGHAILWDQVPDWGGGHSGAIGEGFGDYWTGTFSARLSNYHDNWVYNWDGHNEFRPGRVLDYPGIYPDQWTGDIYHDGQIWSNALWRIRDQIGADNADALIIQANYFFEYGVTVEDAAQALLLAEDLLYHGDYREAVGTVLFEKGFIAEIPVYGTVHGSVTDLATGQPLPGTSVRIENLYEQETDNNGFFTFPTVSIGLHRITVTRAHFTPWSEIIEVLENEILNLNIRIGQSHLVTDPEQLNVELFIDSQVDSTIFLTNTGEGEAEWYIRLEGEEQPTADFGVPELSFPVSELTGDSEIFGICEWNGDLVTSGANNQENPNHFYRISTDGTLIASWNQPTLTAWGFRELVVIDSTLYGSDSRWITGMTIDGDIVDSIPGPHNPNRALAFDPENEILWTANRVDDLVAVNRQGVEQARFTPEITIRAMAWFPADSLALPLYAFRWSPEMDTVSAIITPIDPANGVPGASFTIPGQSTGEVVRGACVSSHLAGFEDAWMLAVTVKDTVDNSCRIDLFRLEETVPWLEAFPSAGRIEAGGIEPVRLAFNSFGLRDGFYYAAALIHYNGSEDPLNLPISLRVTEVKVPEMDLLPEQMTIGAPWPNPFNGSVMIPVTLSHAAKFTLEIYNLLGERISLQVVSFPAAGQHFLRWEAPSTVPSGVYFARLSSSRGKEIRKLLLLR